MYGDAAAQAIQLGIEYDPALGFDAGSPDKAPGAVVDAVKEFFAREESQFRARTAS